MAQKIMRYLLPGWDEFYAVLPKGAVILGIKRTRLLFKADPQATMICRRFRVLLKNEPPENYPTFVGVVEGSPYASYVFTDEKEYETHRD